jgi:hypothetical protein
MEIYQGNHGIDGTCTPSMHTYIVDGINSFDRILLSTSLFVVITFLVVEDMIVIMIVTPRLYKCNTNP